MSNPEIDARVVKWAFDGYLPYGSYPEAVVEDMNEGSSEHMEETVALSHFYTRSKKGDLRMCEFSPEDIVQGEFRRFELTENGLHLPVGIRMNVNLVPGSSPGITREEVVPLWSERAESLRIPNFDYRRTGGSIWKKVLESRMRMRL
ncbi:MAG TPA: hypothetical protein VFW77_02580 [Candidatus Saccharimonadales bacterium]|nr:hypothetical protein [Candidatus Saccharimonadales bacterium]